MTLRRPTVGGVARTLAATLAVALVAIVAGTSRGDASVPASAAAYLESARGIAYTSAGPFPLRFVEARCTADEHGTSIAYVFEPAIPFLGSTRTYVAAGPIPTASCTGDCAFAIAAIDAGEFARSWPEAQPGSGCGPDAGPHVTPPQTTRGGAR
jgi:hypothetical protein